MKKSINDWTRKEFEDLPSYDVFPAEPFDSLVIMPKRTVFRDTGFRNMEFIGVTNHRLVCRLSDKNTDVMFIYRPKQTSWWQMDCLKTSGFLHLYCRGCRISIEQTGLSLMIDVVK